MVQSSEAVSLVIGSAILVFLFVYRGQLKRIPAVFLLMCGYCSMYASLVLTVLEGFFWGETLNLLEHAANAGCVVFLVSWLWTVSRRGEEGRWS